MADITRQESVTIEASILKKVEAIVPGQASQASLRLAPNSQLAAV